MNSAGNTVDAIDPGYVVAGVCVAADDDGEYFEPSKLWPEP